MQLISLASGSKGNAYYVQSGSTSILVDAGLSAKQLSLRLLDAGIDVSEISAVFITHEHVDHIGGVRVFAKKMDIPVYMNPDCLEAARLKYCLDEIKDIRLFNTGHIIDYQDIRIHPLSISHDTSDPVCFTFDDGKHQAGIVTDLGKMNTLVATHLKKLDALILEANHDLLMLKANLHYPEYVKQRIRSSHGHLSNIQSAEAARDVMMNGKLKFLQLAHLSEKNNSEEEARRCFEKILGDARIDLPFSIARQHSISEKIIL
jgi:phosphoribosyl 1,2-cyclic phosphodiesterase